MIRYALVATALKLFSMSAASQRMYRQLGNRLGEKRRTQRGLPSYYLDRARLIQAWCDRYQMFRPGDCALEIGTGWVHWESLIVSLFYEIEVTLFDVWDNRQLSALKRFCAELDGAMDTQFALTPAQVTRAHELLRRIQTARSLDELYELLHFHYVVAAEGTLDRFADGVYAAIYSGSVLQHVRREILDGYICDIGRLLKPGGYSMHTVDLHDQLYYYDRSVPSKNYMRFSDQTWQRMFQNDVQYFNRVQRPEWLALFRNAGLELVEEEIVGGNLGAMRLSRRYQDLDRRDQTCMILRIVHRKPAQP